MPRANIRTRARRSVNAARQYIEMQIEKGLWKAGEQLPPERDLVERFGVSRNTLRKTLKEMEAEGVIVRHVGRGTFVSERDSLPAAPIAGPNNDDPLIRKIQRSSPSEVMDLRLMLEPQSGEMAASRATMNDLAAMEKCLKGCETAKSVAEFEDWDGRLHQTIVSSARNQLLSDIYDAINSVRHSAEWGKLKERSLTSERRALYIEQHRTIVTALQERDPERARQEIRRHLIAVKEGLGAV
jgi:GntR family transcriptional repressor for pyruvate dehydrogenase complex